MDKRYSMATRFFLHQPLMLAMRRWIFFYRSRPLLFLIAWTSVNSCTAMELEEWRVNSWGSIAPVVTFQGRAAACARQGIPSILFKVISRGNGDAEIVLPSVLEPNNAYRFTVWLHSDSPVPTEVFFRRDEFPYEATAIRSVNVAGWTKVSLSGIHASSGRGSVRIAVRKVNASLCINSVTLEPIDFFSIGASDGFSQVDARFFGIHLNRLGMHNNWPTFDPGTLRLWDSGTTWSQLQPFNAQIDWKKNPNGQRLDYYTKFGSDRHRDLQFIYTMGMTPTWAGSKQLKDCNNSSYGASVCTKPVDIESWRRHVRDLGLRYKGAIHVWEIWNESDVWFQWDQTPEDLVQIVKIAAQELKSIDPANQVIGPNITGGGMRFLNRFLTAGGAAYLDGISIHAYLGHAPELSLAQIRNLRQMLKDAGAGALPIWNTETGVSCNALLEDCKTLSTASRKVISGEDALAQGLIGNAALGVKSFVYYTWEGAAVEHGGLPLVESDYKTPTKAGRVFSTVKAWLMGAQVQYRSATREGLNVVEVRRGDATYLALWSSGAPVKFDLAEFTTGARMMRSGDGVVQPLLSTQLDVGAEPVMVFSSPTSTAQ